VAEFARNLTFASFGNFRPQAGSSAQSFSEINLRGLGSQRTLVLLDGRRVAKAPNVGSAADLNAIPLAAVERVEVLTDGASATYGSDAIGGVINFILRKDFDGAVFRYGETKPSVKGGDRTEMSAVLGMTGDKGRFLIGASHNDRDIIFQRDAGVPVPRGASGFGNNFTTLTGTFIEPVGGDAACAAIDGNKNFFIGSGGRCRYDFTGVASDEAAVANKSLFARGEVKINDDWSAFFNGSLTNNATFGRYAPVPGNLRMEPGSIGWNLLSPAAQTTYAGQAVLIAHRFAAGGNRDTETDNNLYDATVGVKGSAFGWDIEVGARKTVSQFYEIGRGFVIQTLAEQAIADGSYPILAPFSADPLVLAGFTATTGRDALWSQRELYASGSRDLFKMAGGNAAVFVGIEHRRETYSDIYDSLSEGGVVLGSSGNSAGGSRGVYGLGGELLLPVLKNLEATISARYEKYSDYGSDFSPKVGLAFQPIPTLKLRASFGKGFSAPTLPQLTQKPAFSADSIVDREHCLADGNTVAFCDAAAKPSFQINGLQISNPELTSEKSTQYGLGAIWDITPSLSVKLDFWDVKIKDVISDVTAQELVNRDNGISSLPIPAGLSVTRDATGFITQVVRGSTNEGELARQGVDLNVIFQHKYASLGSFRHELTWSHVTKASTNGVEEIGEFGQPKDRVTLGNSWTFGPFVTTWNVNHIGKHGEAAIGFVGGYTTHDLQLAWETPVKGLKLTVGALNAFDKLPQAVSDDTRQFSFELYDQYGAQYYGRVELKF
jgi:iron complex outermembrane recepter protein